MRFRAQKTIFCANCLTKSVSGLWSATKFLVAKREAVDFAFYTPGFFWSMHAQSLIDERQKSRNDFGIAMTVELVHSKSKLWVNAAFNHTCE